MTEKRFKRLNHFEIDDTTNNYRPIECASSLDADIIYDLLNELHDENQLLKQALRELLEEEGNAYVIELLDKIFDLKYCEWQKKMNDTETYDYMEWEEILEQKRDEVE